MVNSFEQASQYVRRLEKGFDGLDLFRSCFENTALLSDEEADLLDRFIERAGSFVGGAQAVLSKVAELENQESES